MFIEYVDSPIGKIKISANDHALVGITVGFNEKANPSNITNRAKNELMEYFSQERTTYDLSLSLSGTDFQKAVWKELVKIEYGDVISYKELAKRLGNEKACRAVANAVGKNPLMIIVPCHRVIASKNKLGGFTGGIEIKKKLLAIEGSLKNIKQ